MVRACVTKIKNPKGILRKGLLAKFFNLCKLDIRFSSQFRPLDLFRYILGERFCGVFKLPEWPRMLFLLELKRRGWALCAFKIFFPPKKKLNSRPLPKPIFQNHTGIWGVGQKYLFKELSERPPPKTPPHWAFPFYICLSIFPWEGPKSGLDFRYFPLKRRWVFHDFSWVSIFNFPV